MRRSPDQTRPERRNWLRLRAVLFGYFRASEDAPGANMPGQLSFICLSPDIVAHEVTHAVVDRLRPFYNVATNPHVRAFHEAFAVFLSGESLVLVIEVGSAKLLPPSDAEAGAVPPETLVSPHPADAVRRVFLHMTVIGLVIGVVGWFAEGVRIERAFAVLTLSLWARLCLVRPRHRT
jgi:hypothetical protein